jgi:hypothetical protein
VFWSINGVDAQPVRLRFEEPPEESGEPDLANLPRDQYRALLRSVERRSVPEPRHHGMGDDDLGPGFSGSHARLPRRPIGPSDNAMVVFTLN